MLCITCCDSRYYHTTMRVIGTHIETHFRAHDLICRVLSVHTWKEGMRICNLTQHQHNVPGKEKKKKKNKKIIMKFPLDRILFSRLVATGEMNLLTVWNSRWTDWTSLQASPFSPDRFGAMLCWLFDAIISFMPEHEEDYFASRSSVPHQRCTRGEMIGNMIGHDRQGVGTT